MISQKAIQYLYDKYSSRPESPDCLDINLLVDIPEEYHHIHIDERDIEIGSVCSNSPFRKINLRHINAIVDLEENIAIVLNYSIIFLSKLSRDISIDIKKIAPGVIDKFLGIFKHETDCQ